MRSKAFNVRIYAYGRTRPEPQTIRTGFCIPAGFSGREGRLRFFLHGKIRKPNESICSCAFI